MILEEKITGPLANKISYLGFVCPQGQLCAAYLLHHPQNSTTYVITEAWQKRGVLSLREMLPSSAQKLLDVTLKEKHTD